MRVSYHGTTCVWGCSSGVEPHPRGHAQITDFDVLTTLHRLYASTVSPTLYTSYYGNDTYDTMRVILVWTPFLSIVQRGTTLGAPQVGITDFRSGPLFRSEALLPATTSLSPPHAT